MKIASYILILLIGFGLCLWFMRGCYGKSGYQVLEDSLNLERKKNDSIRSVSDTLELKNIAVITAHHRDTAIYKHKIDSQSRIISVLKGRLIDTTNKVYTSYLNLKKYYNDHDTLALKNTFENLGEQLHSANNLLFQVSLARDSGDRIRNDEIARSHAVIDTLQSEITQFKGVIIDCLNNNTALSSTAQKAIKKSKGNSLLSKLWAGIAALLAVILIVK